MYNKTIVKTVDFDRFFRAWLCSTRIVARNCHFTQGCFFLTILEHASVRDLPVQFDFFRVLGFPFEILQQWDLDRPSISDIKFANRTSRRFVFGSSRISSKSFRKFAKVFIYSSSSFLFAYVLLQDSFDEFIEFHVTLECDMLQTLVERHVEVERDLLPDDSLRFRLDLEIAIVEL